MDFGCSTTKRDDDGDGDGGGDDGDGVSMFARARRWFAASSFKKTTRVVDHYVSWEWWW